MAIIHGEAEGKKVDVQDSVSVSYPDENQMLYSENNLPRGISKNAQATEILHATYLYCKQELLCRLRLSVMKQRTANAEISLFTDK
jgi:hypothetical protein